MPDARPYTDREHWAATLGIADAEMDPESSTPEAYATYALNRAAPLIAARVAEEIARAIEVNRGDRCPECDGKPASAKWVKRGTKHVKTGRCGAGHTWDVTEQQWHRFDGAEIAREHSTPTEMAHSATTEDPPIRPLPGDAEEVRALIAERDEARAALADLVRLKDGPRDAAYETAKPAAWSRARAFLAADGQRRGGGRGRDRAAHDATYTLE